MKRVPMLCVLVVGFALLPWPDAVGQAVQPDEVPEGLAASDWSGIKAAYEAGRHAVHPVEGGYRARNPGQQWQTSFDGRGFTTEPDAGGWTWGLELLRYGFDGQERTVASPVEVSAKGQRVAYGWDDTITEWYVNDRRGLEHGYTVHRRPLQGEEQGPLILTLAVRGQLAPEVVDDGRGVRFLASDGATVLTYSGLTVLDADGHTLPASFGLVSERLLLTVRERGARYPLTIDPIAQQAYLKASNTDSFDYFGDAVAMWGDTLVIGAFLEESSATGVDGNQSDNSIPGAGAVYVFVRSGTTWSQQAYLKASNTGWDDHFGSAVAVSGDTLVVGAPGERSNATGVNGNQNSNLAKDAGAAYVFVRSGTSWSQQAYLKATNTDALDFFGGGVSISGDTVVVGASGEDSSATGINGDQSDDSAKWSGAAYVFVRNGASWSQQAYLKASNTEMLDYFGSSVSASGDTVVVGAQYEDSSATGVNGNQGGNGASGAGAAYVFVRSGATWSQQAYLKASNTGAGDEFGRSMSVHSDTLVVGARFEDSSAAGVDGNQSDNSASDAGAAYVFVRTGAKWRQEAYLKASNTDADDEFGLPVSVRNDTVVVGARLEDSNATVVNGDQGDNSASEAGAAYFFVRNAKIWSQQAYLKASNSEGDAFLGGDLFGSAVAVTADTVVVGAQAEESSATGVNGDQGDNSAPHSGAVYVFRLPTCQTDLGFNGPGAVTLQICGDDLTLADSEATLSIQGASPLSTVFLPVGVVNNPTPLKGGILVPFPWLLLVPLPTDANGTITADVRGSGNPPVALYMQVVDPIPGAFEFSNALEVVIGP